MITIISSRIKRSIGIVLLSLVIFTVLLFLFPIIRFFYWSQFDSTARVDQATWHHIYTRTTAQETEPLVSDKFAPANIYGYIPESFGISRPCPADLRIGYLSLPFPFLKYQSGGCGDIVDYYINYEFALKSFVLYLIFLTIAICTSYKIILNHSQKIQTQNSKIT